MISCQLETFVKTADAGSFGKAADALYISTPAVVQQINLLEDSLGFRVFERSNRGVKLTPAGPLDAGQRIPPGAENRDRSHAGIRQPVYADIHPGLKTIPLDMERDFTVPCGLMIANDPSPAVKRFVAAVERVEGRR